MSNLWDWFLEREHHYAAIGDRQRLQMVNLHRHAWTYCETDPSLMVETFRKGRDMARQLGEPWWVFFYEVWIAVGYLFHVGDFTNGLKQALHCVHEARKPSLKDHPWRIASSNKLLTCYVNIDPIGHADAIEACLRELDGEISPGPSEQRYLMIDSHRKFAMALGQLSLAEELSLTQQVLFDQDPIKNRWYLVPAVQDVCWIAYHQQDWPKLQAHAEQTESITRALQNTQLDLVEAQLWQALTARKAGDENRAGQLFRSAMSRHSHIVKKPSKEHYDAHAHFHEAGNELEKALEVRDRQLAELAGKGRYGCECETHIKRCELLAKLGRLTREDLERALTATRPLKKPASYQERIRQMEV